MERANGVIGDTLRAYANGRKDDWDSILSLAEIRHQQYRLDNRRRLDAFLRRPRRTPPSSTLAASPQPRRQADYLQRMRAMEATVRELLAAAQFDRKAKLDAGRVDTVFKVGDRVLLRTKELLDASDFGNLHPRLDDLFKVLACTSLDAYTLALPRRMRYSPTVNVDRLKL